MASLVHSNSGNSAGEQHENSIMGKLHYHHICEYAACKAKRIYSANYLCILVQQASYC